MIKRQLLVVLILLSIQSFAQYNKGQVMTNGNVNIYSTKSNVDFVTATQKVNQQWFGGSLNAGYFFTNHFAIGLSGGMFMNKNKTYGTDTSLHVATSTLATKINSLGVFLRYNQPLYKSKLGIFLKLGSEYSVVKVNEKRIDTYVNYPSTTTVYTQYGKGYNYYLSPGLFYFVNNRLSLEASLGFLSYYKSATKESSDALYSNPYFRKESGLNTNFSISSISLGITIYLGKNKNAASDSPAAETK